MRVTTTSAQATQQSLKKFLGWDTAQAPVGAQVHVKKLTGRALHTWHGMVGYVRKDRNQPHCRGFTLGISEDELHLADMEYEKLGAGPLKGRTQISPHNLMGRAANFWHFQYRGDRNRSTLPSILLAMVRSGRYHPSGSWVMASGGRGMSYARGESLWRCMVTPTLAMPEDIHNVFFHTGGLSGGEIDRYFSDDLARQRGQHLYGAFPIIGEPQGGEGVGAAAGASGSVDPCSSRGAAATAAAAAGAERVGVRVGASGSVDPCSSRGAAAAAAPASSGVRVGASGSAAAAGAERVGGGDHGVDPSTIINATTAAHAARGKGAGDLGVDYVRNLMECLRGSSNLAEAGLTDKDLEEMLQALG
jgi:hypothetical protein